MKIAVGLSGGVDSAVAALLLIEAGHEVIGVTMRLWDGPSETKDHGHGGACYGPGEDSDVEDCRRICSSLGIPLHEINCAEQYRSIVLEYLKQEYRSGKTPNPCVRCNHMVKFGLLPLFLKKSGVGFDRFSTGHYARIFHDTKTGRNYLQKAADEKKDQSYFLYRLDQDQLSSILFPLGELTKQQVRQIAHDHKLPVSEKPESQDFYEGELTDLIGCRPEPGIIRNTSGEVLGSHDGIWNYTIGQRKGLKLTNKEPLYVVKMNASRNELIVGTREELVSGGLVAGELTSATYEMKERVIAKIRSSHLGALCHTVRREDKIEVLFDTPQNAITPGQAVVFYDDTLVVGGGTIESSRPVTQ